MTREQQEEIFRRHVRGLKAMAGGEHSGLCPFHDDSSPSFSVNLEKGVWFCHACSAGGNVYQFAHKMGERVSDRTYTRTPVAYYDYTDEDGHVLYQKIRYVPKSFGFQVPADRGWTNRPGCMQGVRRVLYRLPEVIKAKTVLFSEGEKDVETLRTLGRVATTTDSGGGRKDGSLSPTLLRPLADKEVVLLPDNDEAGREFAGLVAKMLSDAEVVRLLELPGLSKGGDVTWWLSNGHSIEELDTLIKTAPCVAGKKSWEAKLTVYEQIEETEIEWLWYPYIPRGRLTILEGDPGQGKSYFALALASSVTHGIWPFEFAGVQSLKQPGQVIYLSCEDDPGDTVKKRLRVLAADQAKVYQLEGKARIGTEAGKALQITLEDIGILADAIDRTGAMLVIVDPVQAYLPRWAEMNKAEKMRPVMGGLAELAREKHCAILVIRHLSKGSKERAIYKGAGTIDLAASARSVLLCAEVTNLIGTPDPSRKCFAVAMSKSNLPTGRGLAIRFDLEPDSFLWAGTADLMPDDLLVPCGEQLLAHKAMREIKEFLDIVLRDGSVDSEQVKRELKQAGLEGNSLKDARLKLGVKLGKGDDGKWYWSLSGDKGGELGN